MEITVSWTAYYNASLARADALGPRLRFLSVALLGAYANATVPADNFTAAIPWTRASAASAPPFSALCYYFGAQVAEAYPDLPVGLLANAWGGVPIEVYMSPAALATCAAAPASGPPRRAAAAIAAADSAIARARGSAGPSKGSCLYNSMMHPLLSIPITALLWYRSWGAGARF